jgi:hypothetical protein
VIWALRNIKEGGKDPSALAGLFEIAATSQVKEMASKVYSKDFRVFFFDSSDGYAHDISGLDPSAVNDGEAGWGDLTDFSGRIADMVSSVVAE